MRALGLLLAFGITDLIATAILNAHDLIEERNPLMAPLLARGEWGFVIVKGTTLVVGVLLGLAFFGR